MVLALHLTIVKLMEPIASPQARMVLFLVANHKHLLRVLSLVIALLAMFGLHGRAALAQPQSPQWSPPQRIPGYAAETLTPHLVTDQNRTVHAFASQAPDEGASALDITYRRWTVQSGWTDQIDIILPPPGRQQARVEGAFLDKSGIMHLLFFGGNDAVAEFYYASAPAYQAAQAPAWKIAEPIGEQAVTPNEAALVGDSRDYLYALYSGRLIGNGLYALQSIDGGDSWSEPVSIFQTYDSTRWPLGLKMYVDRQDRVHAVWAVVNSTGNSESIYYAHLENEQSHWSEPTLLSDVVDLEFETDTPNIVEYNGELLAIYHYDQPTTRWIRRSDDVGLSWSEPVKAFPSHIGSNGPVTFVTDSNDGLHVFFGQRTGPHPADHGMWHSTWEGNQWRPPQAIISAKVRDDFDPSFANAVVSQGNVILVTWMTDPGKLERGTWYSYTTLGTPELPVKELPMVLPTPLLVPTVAPTPTLTPTPTLVSLALDTTADNPSGHLDNPTTSIVVSIVPVMIMVLSLMAVRNIRNHRFD